MLIHIGNNERLSQAVAIGGGTAMHHMLLDKPQRHTENLELLMRSDASMPDIVSAVQEMGIGFGMQVIESDAEQLALKKQYPYYDVVNLKKVGFFNDFIRINVYIDNESHANDMANESDLRTVTMENAWFSGSAKVPCAKPEAIAAFKMALLNGHPSPRILDNW